MVGGSISATVISAAAAVPVLRPLVGMDKREIMDYARREGTFEISIVPDQDCCTLFVPRHPTIAAKSADVEAAEAKLDVEALVASALAERKQDLVEPAWASTTRELAEEIS